MEFFLLLTAMLCSLPGLSRSGDARSPAVETSRVVAIAQAVAPLAQRTAQPHPQGYVAPAPLVLDLAYASGFILAPAAVRRRE